MIYHEKAAFFRFEPRTFLVENYVIENLVFVKL